MTGVVDTPDRACADCGCMGYRHCPGCGCCLDCGNTECPEYRPNGDVEDGEG